MFKKNKKTRKIKKDYQFKNLNNPFFRKKQKKMGYRLAIAITLGIISILSLVIWFFYTTSFWQIQVIEIEGLTRVDRAEIESMTIRQMQKSTRLFFSQNNIFLFKKQTLEKEMLDVYNFSNVDIIKKFPRTLLIRITERPYAFIFEQGSDLFFVSRDAYIVSTIDELNDEDRERYFILENKNDDNIIKSDGRLRLSDDYLQFIFSLTDYLKNSQELRVEKCVIDMEFNTIKVKFINGPLVYFNTKDEAGSQVERLILVKNEKIKDNFSTTNYIDLRYGDKIFIN